VSARFTIDVEEGHTSLHVASTGAIPPARTIDLAMEALQGEKDALAACPAHRDSGRLPKGEDSRSEAECEASQSGPRRGASPKTRPGRPPND